MEKDVLVLNKARINRRHHNTYFEGINQDFKLVNEIISLKLSAKPPR